MVVKGNLRNIFFDLDNTLWDFKKNSSIALWELYYEYVEDLDKNNLGQSVFLQLYTDINHKLWEDYRSNRIDKDTLRYLRFAKTLAAMGIDGQELACTIEDEFVRRTSIKPHMVDHAVEILDYLYDKYTLGIITNGFVESQYIKLKNCNLEKYFKYVIISEEAGVSKPDPAIIDYTLKSCGLLRNETVYVGDDYNVDMVCATNSGILGIWLNREGELLQMQNGCTEIKDLLMLKEIF